MCVCVCVCVCGVCVSASCHVHIHRVSSDVHTTETAVVSTSVPLWNQVIESGAGKPLAVATHDKEKASDIVGLCAKGFSMKAGPAVDIL